jgi:hypothetical protein
MASLNRLPKNPNPIPNHSALVSACFVFWLFASVQRSLPMPLEACRKPKAKRPSRALPPATIRPESFVLLHEIARAESDAQAVPQPRYAACSAVLGSSLDCVWPDVARLLVPYTVLAGVPILQGYCNKKTLFSNPCRCASQYRSTCRLEWAFSSWCTGLYVTGIADRHLVLGIIRVLATSHYLWRVLHSAPHKSRPDNLWSSKEDTYAFYETLKCARSLSKYQMMDTVFEIELQLPSPDPAREFIRFDKPSIAMSETFTQKLKVIPLDELRDQFHHFEMRDMPADTSP